MISPNQPHRPWFGIRTPLSHLSASLLGLLPLLLISAAWAWLTHGDIPETRLISPVILPSPIEVFGSFPALWTERQLLDSIFVSFRRVLSGFLLAAAIAVPLGILMGAFSNMKAMFNPIAIIGSYLPIAALVPLTLSWFGIDELQKTIFLALAAFVVLLPMVFKAIDDVDDVYIQMAYTLGATRSQVVFKVLIPIAITAIYESLRSVFGVGWSYIILAEVIAAEHGLGFLIIASQRRGPREHIYLVLLVIIFLAFLTDKLLVLGGKFLFPHRPATSSAKPLAT